MIAVIDYGMGNLRSVGKALERVGGKVKLIHSAGDIEKAEALVLPGVGAFYQAMENLKNLRMIETLCQAMRGGKPFLGICLGLQLLFGESEEGEGEGLSIIPGKVKRFKGENLKVPHMGWNAIHKNPRPLTLNSQPSLLEGIPPGSYFYFAHSYYVEPKEEKVIITTTEYGIKFTSVIGEGNIFGVQFHPEKSGEKGLKLLKNFVQISQNNRRKLTTESREKKLKGTK